MVVDDYEMPEDWAKEFGFGDGKDEYAPFIKQNATKLLTIMRSYLKFDDEKLVLKDIKKGLKAINCLDFDDFSKFVEDGSEQWIKFFSKAFDIDEECAKDYLIKIKGLIQKKESALYDKNVADDDPGLLYNSPSAIQRYDEAEEKYYQAKAEYQKALLTKHQLKVLSASA